MITGYVCAFTSSATLGVIALDRLAQVPVTTDATTGKLLAVAAIIGSITGLVKVFKSDADAKRERATLTAKIDELTAENRRLAKGTDAKVEALADQVRKPVVVIVEDDVDTYTTLSILLNSYGFTTHIANTSRLARVKLNHDPDWVILDIGLPDGTGWEVIREFRRRDLAGRVMVYTAQAATDAEFQRQWADLSRDGDLIVPKASEPKRLIAALKSPPPHKLTPSDPDLPQQQPKA